MTVLPLASALAATLAAAPGISRPFEVGPVPKWVVPVEVPTNAVPPSDAEDGIYQLLLDRQTRLSGPQQEKYSHAARRIVTTAGTEHAEIAISFAPSYQRLTLHSVQVIRGSTRRDALLPGEIKVAQQESDLERRQFDDGLVVMVVPRDVQVGDVLEWSWTLRGANPIFGDKLLAGVSLSSSSPIERLFARFLHRAGRPVAVKQHNGAPPPRESVRDGWREWTWDMARLPGLDTDDQLPAGHDPFAWAQLSEFGSWAEVVRWAEKMFQVRDLSSPMWAQVERWRMLGDDEARARAALEFVQDEVRYFGFEMGAHSHLPHPPATVFERRFGDCKDKSLLLVTLLAAMGIESAPALVATGDRQEVATWLPAPVAFDHAIVRVRLGGRTHWLDPTHSQERGPLSERPTPPWGKALVVAPGVSGLEEIPAPQDRGPDVEIEQLLVVGQAGQPTELTVTSRFRGAWANSKRQEISASSIPERSKAFLNFYARSFSGIEATALASFDDDPGANVVTVVERYRLKDFWMDESQELFARDLAAYLPTRPRIELRKSPLGVTYPMHVLLVVRVRSPSGLAGRDATEAVRSKAFELLASRRTMQTEVRFTFEYRSVANAVEPNAVAAHLADLNKAYDLLEVTLTRRRPASGPSSASPEDALVFVAVASAILIGIVLLASNPRELWQRLKSRLRRRRFARKFDTSAGESPGTAIEVEGVTTARARAEREHCSCGGMLATTEPGADDQVVFGGQPLLVVRTVCEKCRRAGSRYFRVPHQ
ncbi:MAG: DUF3857 domain-containing transglutaminase family protein [Deltaproteobacteria bacterium]|nr:DUF3857 domain-containing transglutaminase family protein [Deltaproteobacteria bacterium]